MKVLCKKNYIDTWGVEKYFKKGRLYNYEKDVFWYHDKYGRSIRATIKVYYNIFIIQRFTDENFNEYFYSESELRKLKLEKINVQSGG